jgi:hypothetical protein
MLTKQREKSEIKKAVGLSFSKRFPSHIVCMLNFVGFFQLSFLFSLFSLFFLFASFLLKTQYILYITIFSKKNFKSFLLLVASRNFILNFGKTVFFIKQELYMWFPHKKVLVHKKFSTWFSCTCKAR